MPIVMLIRIMIVMIVWLYKLISSIKLRRFIQTIISLANDLNQGTTRGVAVGFRVDSLLKLNETRAKRNKMTLMHYLCQLLADKLPELLDFSKELCNLEPASKIQLKILAEEMSTIRTGLEKVVEENNCVKKMDMCLKNFVRYAHKVNKSHKWNLSKDLEFKGIGIAMTRSL
uniref:FH2 domain-containing protein n=1 Tax=Lactuca sativa TaxID=4236 RepID=A0A9R1UW70_LACSA|nr:hypothetical protein LSAT_V11C800414550 [Lactuca sativa]